MLPNAHKPWAKKVATAVICATLVALAFLAYVLKTHNSLHISEIVGIFLLFLAIVPPNLAVIYPWLLPSSQGTTHRPGTKSTAR